MQVIAKNQYAVRVHNLPEHEQLILKMIFAISQKSAASSNGYTQITDAAQAADLVIRDADADTIAADSIPELLVVDHMPEHAQQPVLLRPLIATRVLAVLDDVMAQVARAREPLPLNNSGVVVQLKPAVPPQDVAIVADDADSHPDNFASADITPYDSEAVAAAVDAMLLSTPPVEAPVEEIADSALATTRAAPRPRALVVIENAAVRKQLEIELKFFDVDVEYAASARRAIEMSESTDYVIAFVDAVLPEWDGFRICKRIKTRKPQTAVVMMLSQLAAGDRLKGTLSGCDGYLVKPVGRLTFQTLVGRYLPVQTSSQKRGA